MVGAGRVVSSCSCRGRREGGGRRQRCRVSTTQLGGLCRAESLSFSQVPALLYNERNLNWRKSCRFAKLLKHEEGQDRVRLRRSER